MTLDDPRHDRTGEDHRRPKIRSQAVANRALELLAELIDSDPCWYDHNGDCQAHGFFGLRASNQNCAHHDAKGLLDGCGVEWKS